eukprot:1657657-Pleurochrysis_carterae.AAC.1
MAHRPVPVSAAHKPFNKMGKKAIAASAATRKHDPTGGAGGGSNVRRQTALRAPQRAVVLAGDLPLHARQGQP